MESKTKPTFETERLFLRSFQKDDGNIIQPLANDRAIASTTTLPYPYTIEHANEFIERQMKLDQQVNFLLFSKKGFESKEKDVFIGIMGFVNVDHVHKKAEIGYWIGKQFWQKGYATEAGKTIIQYGFKHLKVNRITGRHLTKNVASRNVLKKLGMQFEGRMRQDVIKWDQFEDLDYWAILASDYEGNVIQ